MLSIPGEGGGGILYMCEATTTCDFIVRMVITVISYSCDFGPNHLSLEKLWKNIVKSGLLCRASTKGMEPESIMNN